MRNPNLGSKLTKSCNRMQFFRFFVLEKFKKIIYLEPFVPLFRSGDVLSGFGGECEEARDTSGVGGKGTEHPACVTITCASS